MINKQTKLFAYALKAPTPKMERTKYTHPQHTTGSVAIFIKPSYEVQVNTTMEIAA